MVETELAIEAVWYFLKAGVVNGLWNIGSVDVLQRKGIFSFISLHAFGIGNVRVWLYAK